MTPFKILSDILQVLKVFYDPLGESNKERKVKYQLVFQKKAFSNALIIKSHNFVTGVKILRGSNLADTTKFVQKLTFTRFI